MFFVNVNFFDARLQLRLFERDALNLCNQFELWAHEAEANQRKQTKKGPTDVPTSEKLLQMHNDSFTRVQQMAFDFLQRGQELAQV